MASDSPGSVSSPASGSSSGHDPVLNAALSEMETEGFRPSDPVGSDDAMPESEPVDVAPGNTPAADAPVAETRVAADPAPTVAADPAAPAPDDEYAKAPAFSYEANGQPRTLDYIKTFPGEGALIREADMPRLAEELANGSRYLQQSQTLARQVNDWERLTEWTQTATDGSRTTLTGAAAIMASRVAHGNVLAELNTLKQALADPVTRTALIAGMDENGHIVLNDSVLESLAIKAENTAMKLQQGLAQRFGNPTQQATQAAPVNVAEKAPAVVEHVAKLLGVSGLTADDKTQLAALVPQFIRPATEADRQRDPLIKIGEPMVSDGFHAQVKYLGTLRSEAAKQQTQAVTTATTVAKHNGAMQRARQPAKVAPAKAPTNAPAAPEKKGRDAQWSELLAEGLAGINM
jgi:hypothetical protein